MPLSASIAAYRAAPSTARDSVWRSPSAPSSALTAASHSRANRGSERPSRCTCRSARRRHKKKRWGGRTLLPATRALRARAAFSASLPDQALELNRDQNRFDCDAVTFATNRDSATNVECKHLLRNRDRDQALVDVDARLTEQIEHAVDASAERTFETLFVDAELTHTDLSDFHGDEYAIRAERDRRVASI